MHQHRYFFIENLGLPAGQRLAVLDWLKGLGRDEQSRLPARRMQVRLRPDGQAAIFEALIETDDLNGAAVKNRLAQLIGAALGNLSYATSSTACGPLLTFRLNGTAILRLGLPGGLDADWETSRQAVLGYLNSALAEWEPPEIFPA
jgi:hypothetical protein